MSQSVTLNSSSYTIPDVGENDWGQNVTDFLVAIPGAVLQKSGGTFTLTAEVDFGVTYGLKSAYYKSRAATPATAGAVRLGVADVVSWRNNANGANLDLGVDVADALVYGANKVLTVAGGFTVVDNLAFANQKGVRLMELTANGTNYIGLVAPDAVTASVVLKLPDGAGSTGQVLSTDGTDTLSWINAAGGGTINSGVQGRLAVYPSNGTTLDDVVTMTNTVSVAIAAHGQGSVYTIPDTGSATANFVMTAGTQTITSDKTFTGSTAMSGTLAISVNSIAAFALSQANSFKIDSTNALVSIGTTTMTYPLYVSKSSAGANVTIAIENTESANAASHARLYIVTGGASGGDPFATFYNGIQNYSIGLDNSDSDALCVTGAATLNGTNLLRLTTAGALTTASSITIAAGGLTVTAGGISVTAGVSLFVSGDATNPGISFTGDTNTGFYEIAADSIGVTTAGTLRLQIDATAIASTNTVFRCVSIASATFPEYSFISDTNTGFRYVTTDTVALTTGATDRVTVNAAGEVGIGTGSPGSYNSNARNLVIANSAGNVGIALRANTAASCFVAFQDAENTTIPGLIGYSHNATATLEALDFRVGGVDEVLRLMNSQANFLVGSVSAPSICFSGDTNTGLYWISADQFGMATNGVLRFRVTNTICALYGGTTETLNVTGNDVVPAATTGTINLGTASAYWNDVSYKTLSDRGCIPWCDDGVELVDGTRVSDLKALTKIKKHATKKTGSGLPRLDYTTFPKHSYRRVEDQYPDMKVERDSEDRPSVWNEDKQRFDPAEDAVEMTMMFGVFIGAFKEVDGELETLKKQVTDLNQRIATLEKAA